MKPTRRSFLTGLSLAPLVALFRGPTAKAAPVERATAFVGPTFPVSYAFNDDPGPMVFGETDYANVPLITDYGAMMGSDLSEWDRPRIPPRPWIMDPSREFPDYEASITIKLDPVDETLRDIVRRVSRKLDERLEMECATASDIVATNPGRMRIPK